MTKKVVIILPERHYRGGTYTKFQLYQAQSKHNVTLVFLEGGEDTLSQVFQSSAPFSLLKTIYKIRKTCPDVIITQLGKQDMFGAMYKLIDPRVNWIVTHVGLDSFSQIKNYIRSHLYKHCNSHIFVSNFIAERKREIYNIKHASQHIIWNGTTEAPIVPKRKVSSNFIYVGGINDQKNVGFLVKLFSLPELQEKKFILNIIGDGPNRHTLEGKSPQNIIWRGYQSDWANFANESSFYIQASINEGFGISVIEAMNLGLVPVLSKSGAFPEIIRNGVDGHLLEIGTTDTHLMNWKNILLESVQDAQSYTKMQKHTLETVRQKFSLKQFVDKYDSYIEKNT